MSASTAARQPREKGGTFGTSEAAKRRKAMGINQPIDQAKAIGGQVSKLTESAPNADPAMIREGAQRLMEASAAQTLAVTTFAKIQQKLSVVAALQHIVKSAPRAAAYLVELVDGVHASAPHDVRLRAAGMILDYSGLGNAAASDDRDLSELSLSDLHQRLGGMEALVGESTTLPEVGNAAPLGTETTKAPGFTPSPKRQALE